MWTFVGDEIDYSEDKIKRLDSNTLVVKSGNSFFALQNHCPHQGKPLEDGCIRNGEIICPYHGARFRIRDGEPLGPPALHSLVTYPVKVENGKVYVLIAQ
tara:strand:+ start:318 stop:617 length:300 start_codon:yes stop_codon:yes gene_type:complete